MPHLYAEVLNYSSDVPTDVKTWKWVAVTHCTGGKHISDQQVTGDFPPAVTRKCHDAPNQEVKRLDDTSTRPKKGKEFDSSVERQALHGGKVSGFFFTGV